MIKTYLNIKNIQKEVFVNFPTKEEIEFEIKNSNISEVPNVETAILGYVSGLEYLSSQKEWEGNGDFLWKNLDNNKILLGCKHSYWGDISGYVISALSEKNFKKVIYVGKLGTLNKSITPNNYIATGSKSVFMDGSSVEWNNLFKNLNAEEVKEGIHFTLPSVLQETKEWVIENENSVDFVDPEIGHMAKESVKNNMDFSYLHIISDNLSYKYDEDLSNERKEGIILKRNKLIKIIGDCIREI